MYLANLDLRFDWNIVKEQFHQLICLSQLASRNSQLASRISQFTIRILHLASRISQLAIRISQGVTVSCHFPQLPSHVSCEKTLEIPWSFRM